MSRWIIRINYLLIKKILKVYYILVFSLNFSTYFLLSINVSSLTFPEVI